MSRVAAVVLCVLLCPLPVLSRAEETGAVRLTLAEAVERAVRSSPRLRHLGSLELASEESLRGARAQRLPSLDLTAGYTRSSDVPELTIALPGATPRTIFPNIPDTYRARLGTTLPLYTGGRVAHTIASATGEREAAKNDREAGSHDLVLETTAAYWSLVTAREAARVLWEALASYGQHLVDARNRAEVGMAAGSEVLAVQVERDRAELARLEAESAAEAAEANLSRLLALEPRERVEPVEPLAAPDPAALEDLEALAARALSDRPERAALVARVAAAEARAGVERAGLRPQVGLAAGYDYANPNRKVLPPEPEWRSTWDVGVSLSLNVFDGGRARAAAARAAALAEAAERDLEELDRRIRLEVTQRFLEIETARATVEVAERGLEAAEENRRVSHDRYVEGLSPSSELLDAEAARSRAGLDRVQALAGLRLVRARLDRAVGR